MKKQTVSLLVLLLAASGFFFSCGNTVNKNAYALEFDSIQVNETVHLFGDTANPACNLILQLCLRQPVIRREAERQSERLLPLRLLRRQVHGDDTRRSCQEIYGEICQRLPQ